MSRGTAYGSLYVRSQDDALAATERQYIIKGLFCVGELSAIVAQPGAGKTFLGLYLAHQIALGRTTFGRRVKAVPVLYCSLEGEGGFENRTKAAIANYGKTINFRYIAQSINLFSDEANIGDLIKAILDIGAKIAFIDTLNRAMANGDENTPGDMGKFIRNIDKIRQATGAHMCIVHHFGKEHSRGPRGHSSFMGAADLVLEVEKQGDNSRIISIIKAKDDSAEQQHAFRLKVVELGKDSDSEPITTCAVYEVPPTSSAQTKRKTKALTPELQAAANELRDLFINNPATLVVSPIPGMREVPCVLKKKTLNRWIETGRLDIESDNTDDRKRKKTAAEKHAQRLRNQLKDHGKIGMTKKYVWLIDDVFGQPDNTGHSPDIPIFSKPN